MTPGRKAPLWLLLGLAIASLATIAWIGVGYAGPFAAAAGGRHLMDLRIAGYDKDDVAGMVVYLGQHPDAAGILRSFHTGPALLLPALLGATLFLLLARVDLGGVFFGRAMPPGASGIILFLPVLYAVADYAGTAGGLLVYPPAAASPETIAFLSAFLSLAVRLKFLVLAVIIVLLARFGAYRYLSRQGD